MGVKDLNAIITKNATELNTKQHEVIIIDGSNLLYQVLSSQLSKLKKSNMVIRQWNDAYDLPLLSQFLHIIQNSVNEISNLISRYVNDGAKEIYIVMDPGQTPGYRVNTKMMYDHDYEFIISTDECYINGETIELNLKSAEQELRRKRSNKSDIIQREISYIHQLKEAQNLTDEQINKLVDIFMQAYCFNNVVELLRLRWIVLKNLDILHRKNGLKIIDAIDEADLVIKNIAYEFESSVNILVLSMDTDYHILFADTPNVDVAMLNQQNYVFNPYKCWNSFLGESYSYDVVIRISSILGNDYTVKESLISAKNYDDILSLLNVNGKYNTLKLATRKKISEIVRNTECPNNILQISTLDRMIYNWNKEYFKKYYLSTIIYTNWNVYDRYNILEEQTIDSLRDETSASLYKILCNIKVNYNENDLIVLYKWNSTYIYNDWNSFFDTLEELTFEKYDDIIDYFYDCNSSTIEDGWEFFSE